MDYNEAHIAVALGVGFLRGEGDIATTSLLEKDVRAIEAVNKRLRDTEAELLATAYVSGGEWPAERFRRDLERAKDRRGLTNKRHVQVDIIRPPEPLGYNTGAFTEADIARALDMGREAGRQARTEDGHPLSALRQDRCAGCS